MKTIIIILIALTASPLFAADTIYKTVDEKGNVIYTDKPDKKSEEVTLPPATTYTPKKFPRSLTEQEPRKKDETSTSYKFVRIISPTAGQRFIHAKANAVSVSVVSEPALQKGHRYQLLRNGVEDSTGLNLPWLHRGTHTLVVNIVDENGEVLATSEPVIIHVFRATKKK